MNSKTRTKGQRKKGAPKNVRAVPVSEEIARAAERIGYAPRDREAEARVLVRTRELARDNWVHASLRDMFELGYDTFAGENDSMAERALSSLLDELRVLNVAMTFDNEGALDSHVVERVVHRMITRAEIAMELDCRMPKQGGAK